ncbi:MAG: hypothetical protein JOZ07_17215 [Solirubrobacterales bacterium]|nr:hypothetical protein [Solirubrobacterales bacterium]
MPAVLGRRACLAVVAALGLVSALGLRTAPAAADVVPASVSTSPTGPAMPSGFVGVSFEYRALHEYTGRDPRAIDPVLLSLLRGLVPGQSPIIRIGGNSSDDSWWPIPGVIPPGGIDYRLTPGWLRTTRALAADLNAKLILGVNLAAGSPAIAATEGRVFAKNIGSRYIDALEIGNEPDLYPVFPWYRDLRGRVYRRRGPHYDLRAYTRQFTQWAAALPNLPLAGPGLSGPNWMSGLGGFLGAERRVTLATYHRYPLRACTTDPSDPAFPSIPNLLADSASAGLAAPLGGFVQAAAAHHLPLRIDEMNSASCEGKAGVSDTFASALWALDTMFNFARQGVQGVNFHMLPGSHYELFSTSRAGPAWQAFVHPEYYGLLMFAQAFPPGARLLPVSAPAGPLKVWATAGVDDTVRVVAINQDATAEHDVALTVPGATAAGSLETLTAPSLDATSGVAIGGQTFGVQTATGELPAAPAATPVSPAGGVYSVPVAPGSATLLTISGDQGGTGLIAHG